jgi:hypothetical protein
VVIGRATRQRIASLIGSFALGAVLWSSVTVSAQEPTLQASVDRSVVRDNESFTYTIRAEGAIRGEPELAPLEAEFDVLQRSSSSRIQIVNGETAQVTEWQFQLMPKSVGEFTLPAVRVGNLQTNAVAVRVVPPETSGSAPADIFMELAAEPSTVYVQSQVIFTLRLFIGVATGRATLTAPEITGGEAIIERLGEDGQYQTVRGGRNFIVRERRYAIFPQQAGSLTIGPATFEAMVIPDRGFSRVQRFRSGVLELRVQPAVAPPPTMPGAVWLPARRVTLSETWSDDSPVLVVGAPRTRRLTIEADGLLETQLPELPIVQQAGIRQYADQPELEREITEEGLRSRRSVSLAVIAQSPGDVTLAGLELPWWNVTEQRWEIATLPPRLFQVPSTGEPEPPSTAPASVEPSSVPAEPPSAGLWPIVSGVLALGWLATAVLWWRSRRGGRAGSPGAPSQVPRRTDNPRRLLREIRAACAARDPDTARRGLLEWGALKFPDAPPRSLGALAAQLPQNAARAILVLEAEIYGSAAGGWDGQSLNEALAELDAVTGPREPAEKDPLLPLYR